MESTLISFNIPNLITIPLMAFLGFLLVALVWQLFQRTTGGGDKSASATQGGY
jgi:hypothetical protein